MSLIFYIIKNIFKIILSKTGMQEGSSFNSLFEYIETVIGWKYEAKLKKSIVLLLKN